MISKMQEKSTGSVEYFAYFRNAYISTEKIDLSKLNQKFA
jgi:hypothetical protein